MVNIFEIDEDTLCVEDEFVRFFVLKGKKMAAVIDTGCSGQDIKKIVREFTDLSYILINTHGDGDHAAGTGMFDEIWMAKEDYESREFATKFKDTKLHEISDGDIIDLGDRTLKIIKVPGHTKGSIAILDLEKRVLWPGDSVQDISIYMFGEHRCPERFEESLEKLEKIGGYDKIYSSHGTLELPADYVGKVKESWKRVMAKEIAGTNVTLHGMNVTEYKTDYCGFYC